MDSVVFRKVTLYSKDARGELRSWSISAFEDKGDVVIEIDYGTEGGERIEHAERVTHGLANRTKREQAIGRIKSRINKKLDAGHVFDKNEAMENKKVNSLGLAKPMLAKAYKGMKDKIDWTAAGVFIQRKYNGHRCLIHNSGDRVIAYSRNGKEITTIDHIKDELDIPEGATLDGELYCHGEKLQTITSWVKKSQADSKKLTYIIYDAISNSMYWNRLDFLLANYSDYKIKNSHVAESYFIESEAKALELRDEFIRQGFEGAIIRIPEKPYEEKRSSGLIKLKKMLDDEFIITDIQESSEGWAILKCASKNGKIFGVSAPGTVQEKRAVLKNKDSYIGRSVNIEYAELTKDGKPFHPIAKCFRDKQLE